MRRSGCAARGRRGPLSPLSGAAATCLLGLGVLCASSSARADDRPLEAGVVLGGHFFSSTSALGRSDYPIPGSEIAHGFAVGGRVGYGLTRYFMLEAEFLAIPTKLVEQNGQVLVYTGRGHLLFRWPLGKEDRWQPFILAGGGVLGVRPDSGLPLKTETAGAFHTGLGLRVNINKYVGVRAEGRMVLVPEIRTATFTQDFEVLAGVYGRLGFTPEKPPEPPKPVDTDGDGLIDKEDRCPTEAGIKENDGCPDKDLDGDSVVDRLDKCPDKAGPADNGGCPDTDADGDGVFDRLDKCPGQPGPKANAGCPDTDADSDGIVDRLDKCPSEPETLNNYQDSDGCPDELPEKLAKFVGKIEGIRFAPNRAVLLPQSFPVLDKAVEALQENASVRVEISGHTDNIGLPAQNQALSQQRAEAVKAYLESKGVSPARLVAVGYGSTRPTADNRTDAGRTQNRRVEFQLLPGTRIVPQPKPATPGVPAAPGTPTVPTGEAAAKPPVPAAPVVPQKLAQFIGKLEGIRFMPNQPVLAPQSFAVLNKVAEALAESPAVRVEISGHTDNIGEPAQNQTLSQQRAETVKKYLESKGISADRLTAVGFGSSRPVADNATEAGRAQNRRVELRVLSAALEVPPIPAVPSPLPTDPSLPVVPSVPPLPTDQVPAVPSVPVAPVVPSVPAAPTAPAVPTVPAVPTAPAVPSAPAAPFAPAVPTVPSVPAPPSLPSLPSPPPVPPLPPQGQ